MSFENWNWITDRLATGGGPVTESDVADLIAHGITHIIDCRVLDDPLPPNSQLAYLHNPTLDDGQPKPTGWFAVSLAFAIPALTRDPLIVSGGYPPRASRNRVYCHCDQGIDRGPSTAYAVLRALTGMGGEETKALIIAHRPIDLIGLRYTKDADAALKELGYL